jgi:hypothetical protein
MKVSRAALFALYENRCGHCLAKRATDRHEIEPRSSRPTDWDDETNEIPLCRTCHVLVQADWRKWYDILKQDQVRAARLFGWKEEQDGN